MYNTSVIVSAGGHTPENNARTHVSVELVSINNNDFFSTLKCPPTSIKLQNGIYVPYASILYSIGGV